MSGEGTVNTGGTPVKAGCTPLKSSFLTPCRRMGLKRRSMPSPALSVLNPLNSPLPESPLAKRAQSEPSSVHLDSTPKRKFPPRRKSLMVTRVEKPASAAGKDSPVEPLKSASLVVASLELSIASKKEQISLLQKGVHPMQMEVDRLNKLTEVWRSGCKNALEDLLEQLHRNSEEAAKVLTMNILISNLDVPPDLLHFDSTKEEFY